MPTQDIYFMSVRALGEAIRERRISPVELTEGYLERCRTLGKRLNAFVRLTPELALRQANEVETEIRAGEYRGPLHGVPYVVKDLVTVKGYPTTLGSNSLRHADYEMAPATPFSLNQTGEKNLFSSTSVVLIATHLRHVFSAPHPC